MSNSKNGRRFIPPRPDPPGLELQRANAHTRALLAAHPASADLITIAQFGAALELEQLARGYAQRGDPQTARHLQAQARPYRRRFEALAMRLGLAPESDDE